MINSEFAKKNDAFRKACKKAHVEPTARQASKFRNGRGIAFKFRKHPKTKYIQRQIAINKVISAS